MPTNFSCFRKMIILILVMLLIHSHSDVVLAGTQDVFDDYMNKWTEKKTMASKYLLEAEAAFKNGDELTGCAIQKKASTYGIEATESLIMAMEVNGSTDGLENLETGLNKWKELGDFC